MNFKKIGVILSSLTLMLSLASCGTKEVKTDEANKNSQEARVVKHAMGTTELKGSPERIVILTNEGTEALLALGVKPVGAVKSWTGIPWYKHIEKEMENVANVGLESQVNLEEIAALKPDLIIGNKMRQEKIYDQLSLIAPTVFSETLRGDWKENFKFYAEVLDKTEEGNKLLSDFDNRIKDISATAGDKLNTKISIVRFMAGKTRIYFGDTFSGKIFKQIGFARPESQQSDEFAEEIGKERLKEADGDVIFYFTYDEGNGEANSREQDWLNDPLFKNLNAVKNKKVFKVDDVIWNTAGGIRAANLMLDDIEKFLKNNSL
ncbi:ABC transporter substrate-binding protein [Clostridium bovifaecis]|uniref:ABC transporter substrate-binding protein n=1 Tax=Clostridium bovifaecis TaxID=2184719 RepID=A0A6I6EU57_9CLOT|nr:ABC transporter substrate-binding protein [Clostridium bovifaecis]